MWKWFWKFIKWLLKGSAREALWGWIKSWFKK